MKKRTHDLQPEEALVNEVSLEDPTTIASATDCTGLVQGPTLTESQAESYCELYDIPVTKNNQKTAPDKKNSHLSQGRC